MPLLGAATPLANPPAVKAQLVFDFSLSLSRETFESLIFSLGGGPGVNVVGTDRFHHFF